MINPCINVLSQALKCFHSAVTLFGTIFAGGTKIDKITHLNLNVTCFKGIHLKFSQQYSCFPSRETILSNEHKTTKPPINDTFTLQRCRFGHYFVSDPSLHLFFLVWWNQFPKHKIARQMFAWRSHPLASKGAFCM